MHHLHVLNIWALNLCMCLDTWGLRVWMGLRAWRCTVNGHARVNHALHMLYAAIYWSSYFTLMYTYIYIYIYRAVVVGAVHRSACCPVSDRGRVGSLAGEASWCLSLSLAGRLLPLDVSLLRLSLRGRDYRGVDVPRRLLPQLPLSYHVLPLSYLVLHKFSNTHVCFVRP
jgi:hypothetical protein